jgi:hypothetical protein
MPQVTANDDRDREELKAKRDRLFKRFQKKPMHIHLAIEIKCIDDRLAKRTR